ncbi:MAG: methyl-accepting chemotaxis protein [Pseudanabaenaceae cyanobacterium]
MAVTTKTQKVKSQTLSPSPAKTRGSGGSIGTGLLLAVCGSAVLGVGTLGFVLYQELWKGAQQEMEGLVRAGSLLLAEVKSPNSEARPLSQLVSQKGQGYLVLVDEEGQILSASGSQSGEVSGIPELRAVWQARGAKISDTAQVGGNLVAYRQLQLGEQKAWLFGVLPEAEVRDRVLWQTLGVTVGVALLLGLVVLWFVNYLNRRLQKIMDECQQLAQARGGVVEGQNSGGDELDRLETVFRQLVAQIVQHEERIREETTRLVQNQERQRIAQELQQEQEASEQEVGLLLEVVSSIEEGDLTVEAEVSDRATGLVADTLNRLRERLAETIARVLATAQQVAIGAEELQSLARTVAANTVEQAQSVAQGRALTEQVANSAQSSADQVKIANRALQEVQKTVESAQAAITKLTEGIAVLQKGSAQIVQRMKTLGEFVGLAEQFVQDQSQIASLTQVLAINATLVAARAAEQRDPKQFIGVAREFETIAEQVNALATQTNQGLTVLRQRTGQIQAVVSAVDTEVQSLGGLVAGFTAGVEQSATAFQSVRQVTEQVVKVGQSVTSSSLEIADAAVSTARYISEIATLAEQTAQLTATARQQAETMGAIAQELLTGIRFFRLPEAMLPSLETAIATPTTVDTAAREELELLDFEEEEFSDITDFADLAEAEEMSALDGQVATAEWADTEDKEGPNTFAEVLMDRDLMEMEEAELASPAPELHPEEARAVSTPSYIGVSVSETDEDSFGDVLLDEDLQEMEAEVNGAIADADKPLAVAPMADQWAETSTSELEELEYIPEASSEEVALQTEPTVYEDSFADVPLPATPEEEDWLDVPIDDLPPPPNQGLVDTTEPDVEDDFAAVMLASDEDSSNTFGEVLADPDLIEMEREQVAMPTPMAEEFEDLVIAEEAYPEEVAPELDFDQIADLAETTADDLADFVVPVAVDAGDAVVEVADVPLEDTLQEPFDIPTQILAASVMPEPSSSILVAELAADTGESMDDLDLVVAEEAEIPMNQDFEALVSALDAEAGMQAEVGAELGEEVSQGNIEQFLLQIPTPELTAKPETEELEECLPLLSEEENTTPFAFDFDLMNEE